MVMLVKYLESTLIKGRISFYIFMLSENIETAVNPFSYKNMTVYRKPTCLGIAYLAVFT